jgi:uncharacterized protein YodC (DUF2158 family)
MKHEFNLGDIVQLKSGSPKLTVIEIGHDKVKCIWHNPITGSFSEGHFDLFVLVKANID